jgi:hypothetical protein
MSSSLTHVHASCTRSMMPEDDGFNILNTDPTAKEIAADPLPSDQWFELAEPLIQDQRLRWWRQLRAEVARLRAGRDKPRQDSVAESVMAELASGPVVALLARIKEIGPDKPGETMAMLWVSVAALHAMIAMYGGQRVSIAEFLGAAIKGIESGVVES